MLVAGVADGHGGTFVSDIIKMEMCGLVKKLFSDIRKWINLLFYNKKQFQMIKHEHNTIFLQLTHFGLENYIPKRFSLI